ncbi:MAG: hypothetical protein N2510_10120, partial [Ignavibacteria bacterium]|nr:hypothetical protein [Ignavibacteria bacterium]
PMSASEIAKDAGIIRNSIYDILKNFVEKGYCNEIETDTILNYQIIDPAVIFDKLQRDFKQSFNKKLNDLEETFKEVKNIYLQESQKAEATDKNIQLIRGFNKHRVAKYIELVNNSKKEILGMYSPRRVIVEELSKDAKRFIKGGGVIKSIYQLSGDKVQDSELVKACELFEKGGEQTRLADFRIPNITIFDREYAFINLSTDKTVPKHKQADIILQNSDFAQHLCDLFDYYWDKSYALKKFKK